MEHKFQAIRGFKLQSWLVSRYDFPFFFLNDADAFGYGVHGKVYETPPERLVAITLGTGVGFVRGTLQELEIWNKPYRHGILEDAVSARTIVGRYRELTHEDCSVKEQAERAYRAQVDQETTFESERDEHVALYGAASYAYRLFTTPAR